jgi:hypothetical protein
MRDKAGASMHSKVHEWAFEVVKTSKAIEIRENFLFQKFCFAWTCREAQAPFRASRQSKIYVNAPQFQQ